MKMDSKGCIIGVACWCARPRAHRACRLLHLAGAVHSSLRAGHAPQGAGLQPRGGGTGTVVLTAGEIALDKQGNVVAPATCKRKRTKCSPTCKRRWRLRHRFQSTWLKLTVFVTRRCAGEPNDLPSGARSLRGYEQAVNSLQLSAGPITGAVDARALGACVAS